ncbi:MAG: NHLP family bacteriocin export ABC transporter peptidase/permease/ATPase subunit [Oscillospiraceae bacterium]|nr:NHLP family bacteriocin export ABC transporter peptidase/permease/ATPase subunit [Oscillospiraceae bacterium]
MPDQKVKKPVRGGVAKVPVVMQLEALECGAACLCMIMAFYNKWIPLEQVRADCGVSRDGSTAKNILLAARSYGMTAKGYRLEPEALRENGKFPCIVHWEFNHFVVCDGFRGDKVYLNDPARGSYAVPISRFDEAFTGICLMIEPSESFEPSGKKKSMLVFARDRMRGAGAAVAFVVLTTAIAALANIVYAGFSRAFLDYLLPGKNPAWVTPFFIGLGVLILILIVSDWVKTVYSLRLNGKMAAVGSSAYMWKVLKLPMEFFSQRMAGDIQGRKGENASIASQLVDTFAPLVLNTVMMIFYLIVMLRYSRQLTLLSLSALAVNAALSRWISAKRINITRVAMRDQGKLSGATVGAMDMIETIKASGAENGYFERWAGYQASVNSQEVRFARLNSYLGLIPAAISSLLNAAILILGVYLTMNGEFTVGMIIAFQGFLGQFSGPAGQLISAGQTLQEMRVNMERVDDVMQYPDDPVFDSEDKPDAFTDKLSGELCMKNVTFGYSRLAPPLIENFSLELKRGQRIAFVGASGCGKSTLAKLLSGLYQPWSGEILFDGKPISEIDRSVFTGSVAVVDQDIILFEDSVAGNIKMWDNSIKDFEMILAARDAQIHEDIMQRDGGYQYKLTEGGRDFSGGQRQRLEIARVLAQDPTIIILDEATSALDARTEFDVVESIRERGISCVVVAHRLSTIRDCDEIIVLDHGKVIERGTHGQLMALHGAYEKLVSSE